MPFLHQAPFFFSFSVGVDSKRLSLANIQRRLLCWKNIEAALCFELLQSIHLKPTLSLPVFLLNSSITSFTFLLFRCLIFSTDTFSFFLFFFLFFLWRLSVRFVSSIPTCGSRPSLANSHRSPSSLIPSTDDTSHLDIREKRATADSFGHLFFFLVLVQCLGPTRSQSPHYFRSAQQRSDALFQNISLVGIQPFRHRLAPRHPFISYNQGFISLFLIKTFRLHPSLAIRNHTRLLLHPPSNEQANHPCSTAPTHLQPQTHPNAPTNHYRPSFLSPFNLTRSFPSVHSTHI